MSDVAILASLVQGQGKSKKESPAQMDQQEMRGQESFASLVSTFISNHTMQGRNHSSFLLNELNQSMAKRFEESRNQQRRENLSASISNTRGEERRELTASPITPREKKDHVNHSPKIEASNSKEERQPQGKVEEKQQNVSSNREKMSPVTQSLEDKGSTTSTSQKEKLDISFISKGMEEKNVNSEKEQTVLFQQTKPVDKPKVLNSQTKVQSELLQEPKEKLQEQLKQEIMQHLRNNVSSGKQNVETNYLKVTEENVKALSATEPEQLPLLANLQRRQERQQSSKDGLTREEPLLTTESSEKAGIPNSYLSPQMLGRKDGGTQQPLNYRLMRDGMGHEAASEKMLQNKNSSNNALGATEASRETFKGRLLNIQKQPVMPNRQEILNQVIAQAKLLNKAGSQELKIQLKPDFLGPMKMRVLMEDGIVSIRIAAENPQVRQLLESNMAQLRQSLEEQGIKFDRVDVSKDDSGRDFYQGNQNGFLEKQPGRGQAHEGLLYSKEGELGEEDHPSAQKTALYYESERSTVEYFA
ncbi:flagellar hook-length control protein FliK [Heliorestis acidaminivorans]|uniref:Flagellar hook-length control protein FliK n=1 Tax=Heliorestis acidaminivorans TaxID=553427 RepID=A0A6I0F4D4_9FIRM|nr:flagellar hook-length control protein FliK [Heliorestis acidaminivorans]KAB2954393.1 flagellar hook-length control protein FliK [Heliorestis acidaminivorans]